MKNTIDLKVVPDNRKLHELLDDEIGVIKFNIKYFYTTILFRNITATLVDNFPTIFGKLQN